MACNAHLGQTEIGQLDVALSIDENVLWFKTKSSMEKVMVKLVEVYLLSIEDVE